MGSVKKQQPVVQPSPVQLEYLNTLFCIGIITTLAKKTVSHWLKGRSMLLLCVSAEFVTRFIRLFELECVMIVGYRLIHPTSVVWYVVRSRRFGTFVVRRGDYSAAFKA